MSLIFELNKLVTSLGKITSRVEQTKIDFLKTTYNNRRLGEEISDFETIFEFSRELNLIQIDGSNVTFKENGKEFLNRISKKDERVFLDPNENQKDFLKEKFFEENQFRDEFKKIMDIFWADRKQKEPTLTCLLENTHKFNKFLIRFLQEIRVFEISGEHINCKGNLEQISKIRNKITGVSLEELEARLAENKEIGELGEKLAIEKEKERLEKEGRIDLAYDIKQVSVTDVYAGFDLKSYNDKNSQLAKHDRVIEVKSTRSSSPRFYWSSNEVKKAKSIRKNYWIYLWTSVESEYRQLRMIQNPYDKFFVKNKEKPECTGYFLDKRLVD